MKRHQSLKRRTRENEKEWEKTHAGNSHTSHICKKILNDEKTVISNLPQEQTNSHKLMHIL